MKTYMEPENLQRLQAAATNLRHYLLIRVPARHPALWNPEVLTVAQV